MANAATQVFYERLKAAEAAADAALKEYAELLLSAQRTSIDLSLTFGEPQSVFTDINDAMAHHLRGRHHLARAHARALEIAQRSAGAANAWGDTAPTYDEARDGAIAATGSVVPLRSVA